MARCESVEVLRDIILNGKILDMENSESDSDSDVSCIIDLNMSGEQKEIYGKIQDMENSESDSDSDISCIIDLDMSGEQKENCRDSPGVNNEEKQVNAGPVLSLQCLHEDGADENSNQEPEENEEHPHLVPFKIVTVNGSSSITGTSASRPYSSIPARNNWEGAHNFKIKILCSDVHRKTENLVYSESQNKLYIAKDHPFKVLVNAENVPVGSMIKVTAVFALIEHSMETVQRCPTHAQQDYTKGNIAYEHIVQCFSTTAIYEKKGSSGKLSVSVPYENPQEGETYTTYLFKLTCFSSCSGGINRRPFMLVFTLEKDNIPLGRQILETKVCACPQRDFKIDEERRHKRKSQTSRKSNNKEIPILPDEKIATKYSISVKDPELYQFLMQMKCLYETCAYATKTKPDT